MKPHQLRKQLERARKAPLYPALPVSGWTPWEGLDACLWCDRLTAWLRRLML